MALAKVMVSHGHFDRADKVLAEVDTDAEGLDRASYHSLMGLVGAKLGQRERAIEHLTLATATHGRDEPALFIYLAQALFESGASRCPEALAAIERAGDLGRQAPGYLLRAHCHQQAGSFTAAWAALEHAAARFPDDGDVERYRVRFLIERGLFDAAIDAADDLLESPDLTSEDLSALAEALRQVRAYDRAIALLERGRLRFPEHTPTLALLARTYADADMPRAAGNLYYEATMRDARFANAAAETYRRAGHFEMALRLNGRVADQKLKVKQRLGLLLEMERFEEAIALTPRLSRLDLTGEDPIRYALAFANFKTGRLDDAEAHLDVVTTPAYFAQAAELLRIIALCRRDGECGG